MKKTLWLITAALLFTLSGYGKTVSELGEWYKRPSIVHVDDQKVIIVDKTLNKVFVYSRTDYRPSVQFGRPGTGPGEFNQISWVYVSPKSIMVSTAERISIFSHQGTLSNEIKNPSMYPIIKLEDNFFQKGYQADLITYQILNDNFKKKKELYSAARHLLKKDPATNKSVVDLISHHNHAVVTPKYIIIGDTEKGLYFKVFDHEGRSVREIKRKFERRQVTAQDKEGMMGELIEQAKKSRKWEMLKVRAKYVFSDYFPAYYDFFAQDEKLYVFGYPMADGKQQVSIITIKGELSAEKTIPYIGGSYYWNHTYYIYKDTLYFLFDNEENEKWELRALKIE